MTQNIIGVRRALQAQLKVLFPEAVVSRGDPGNAQPQEIVALQATRGPTIRPTHGANRSRERLCETDVIISIYLDGDELVMDAAEARAMAMGEALEDWLRQPGVDNGRLSGAAYDTWVSNMTLEPDVAWAQEDGIDGLVPAGRIATLTVTVTSRIRF